MAADLLTESKDGKDFMERLRSSLMIEIKYRHSITKNEVIVRVPEAIACSLSSHISKLVATGSDSRRELTAGELLGGQKSFMELKEHLTYGTVLDYLTWFVQWIYTSKLAYNKDLRFFELWIFSSKIECLKLQNEAIRMLGRYALWRSDISLEEKMRQYCFANSDFFENLMYCVGAFTYLGNAQADGFNKDGKVEMSYWEDKKCWLFLLNCAAYFGPGDRRVREVLRESENLDVQIIKRMIDLAKEGGEICPWDSKNIARYLVAEPIFEGQVKEARSMLPPLRNHASGSSMSNGSKKRTKVSRASEQSKYIEEDMFFSAMLLPDKPLPDQEDTPRRPLYPQPLPNSSQHEPS